MTHFSNSNKYHLSEGIDLLNGFNHSNASPFRTSKRSNGDIKSSIFLLGTSRSGIDLVLKYRENWHYLTYSFPYEYAFIAYLWREFPELRSQLPQVYALAEDSQGRILGIITEKFPGNENDAIYEVSSFTFDDQIIIKRLRQIGISEGLIGRLEKSIFNCPDPEDHRGRCIKVGDLEEVGATLADPKSYIPLKQISRAEKIMHRYGRIMTSNLQAVTFQQTR